MFREKGYLGFWTKSVPWKQTKNSSSCWLIANRLFKTGIKELSFLGKGSMAVKVICDLDCFLYVVCGEEEQEWWSWESSGT